MVCFSLVISNQCGQTKNTISSKKKCLFGGNFFYECCTYRLVPTPLMRNIYINHLTNKTWLSPPSRLPSTQCVHGAQSSSSPRKVELPPFSSGAASVDDQDRSSWTDRPAMRTSMEERDRPPSAGGRLSRPGSPRRSRPPSPRLSRPASPHVDHLLPRQGRHFLKPILIIFSQTKLLSAPAAVSRNGTSFLHFHFPLFFLLFGWNP